MNSILANILLILKKVHLISMLDSNVSFISQLIGFSFRPYVFVTYDVESLFTIISLQETMAMSVNVFS